MEATRTRQPGRVRRGRLWLTGGLLVFLGLTGAYIALGNTVLASLQEQIIAPDTTNPVAYGRVLFRTRGCGGCHTLADAGSTGQEGPILTGVGARHDAAYLRRVITDPSTIGAATCPHGPCQRGIMPVWGRILTPSQIDALVQYLSQQT
jgi:mono/diheme cytochrome c family protein